MPSTGAILRKKKRKNCNISRRQLTRATRVEEIDEHRIVEARPAYRTAKKDLV